MKMFWKMVALAAVVCLWSNGARAQDSDGDTAADGTASDSVFAAGPIGLPTSRASWISDRIPLRVGDIVTVVVDDLTSANEKVTTNAVADRRTAAGFKFGSDPTSSPSKFNTQHDSRSREIGEAGRHGALTAVLSVRVIAMATNGIAEIEGTKKVTVDGRDQEVTIKGFVRSQDVSSSNIIFSDRIAGVEITYKGKKISPKSGILGKIISIIWP